MIGVNGATPIGIEKIEALRHFFTQVTVPIVCDSQHGADQIGTGTLIDFGDQLYLVTARHVLENIELTNIGIPSLTTGEIKTIGSYIIGQHREPDIDIAVLALKDDNFVTFARNNWRVLSLDNVKSASKTGSFVLCGYPTAFAIRQENAIGGKLVTGFSERIVYAPDFAEQPVLEGIDLFFSYNREATSPAGETVNTPKLQGVSGCSVWECDEISDANLWTAERNVKIVAVQSAYKHSEYFRAKCWSKVIEVLKAFG